TGRAGAKGKQVPGLQTPQLTFGTVAYDRRQDEGMMVGGSDTICALSACTSLPSEDVEPRNHLEAVKPGQYEKWQPAMEKEIGRMHTLGAWELTEARTGANIVRSKWVYRIKRDVNNNAIEYKSRLVAQGYTQVPGVDYTDTFAPT